MLDVEVPLNSDISAPPCLRVSLTPGLEKWRVAAERGTFYKETLCIIAKGSGHTLIQDSHKAHKSLMAGAWW